VSTYRFEVRSTTPGEYRFKTGFFAGLPLPANVLLGVDRGDGTTGTYIGLSGGTVSLLIRNTEIGGVVTRNGPVV